MSAVDNLVVIFVFGLGMSFVVAKGIWEARDFHQKEVDRENLKASRTSPGKVLRGAPMISG